MFDALLVEQPAHAGLAPVALVNSRLAPSETGELGVEFGFEFVELAVHFVRDICVEFRLVRECS